MTTVPPANSTKPGRFLSQLKPGESAHVLGVTAEGPLGQRLMEMGLVGGTEVHIVRVAPLGDPIELRIDSCRLSLRREEARHVSVGS